MGREALEDLGVGRLPRYAGRYFCSSWRIEARRPFLFLIPAQTINIYVHGVGESQLTAKQFNICSLYERAGI
jgi:hypothetical protein